MEEKKKNNVNAENIYHKDYIPKVHRIGTFSMLFLLVFSFVPALWLSYGMDFHPGWDVVAKAGATQFGMSVFTWILEPVIYFPMIGIAGSYIAFVAGNVTTMRVPAITAAQNAVEAKYGTKKAEIAGVYGIISSVLVNFFFLAIVILFGSYIANVLPEAISDSLKFALPGVYGALLITFAVRLKR